jgi:hypothetical protein
MTTINSDKKIINKSAGKIFNYLSDLNNWENIMPDRVVDWKSTADTFHFTIQGTASLGMRKSLVKTDEQIILIKEGKAPFDFNMEVNLKGISDVESEIQMILNADLNAMLKLLAVSPLTNFLNMLIDKLRESDLN